MDLHLKVNTIGTANIADNIHNQYRDYLSLAQLGKLSDDEKNKMVRELVAELTTHCHKLADNPAAIPSDKIKALADDIQTTANTIAASDSTRKEENKGHIAAALEQTKKVLGPTADIVLSITKLLQLFGSMG